MSIDSGVGFVLGVAKVVYRGTGVSLEESDMMISHRYRSDVQRAMQPWVVTREWY
jgi:hypothetical protein